MKLSALFVASVFAGVAAKDLTRPSPEEKMLYHHLLKLEAKANAKATSDAQLSGSEETEFLRKCEEDSDCACVDLREEAEGGEFCVPATHVAKANESKFIPDWMKDKIGTCPDKVSCACQEHDGWFGKTYKACGKVVPSPSPEEEKMLYHHLLKIEARLEAEAVSAARRGELAPTLRGSEKTEVVQQMCEEDSDCACVDISAEAEGGEYCFPAKVTESNLIPDSFKNRMGTCPDAISCACQERKGFMGMTFNYCAKAV